jgi:hypothetical protein
MQLEKIAKRRVAVRVLRIQDLEIFNLSSPTIQYITETVRFFKFFTVPYHVRKKIHNVPDLVFLNPWYTNRQLGQSQY